VARRHFAKQNVFKHRKLSAKLTDCLRPVNHSTTFRCLLQGLIRFVSTGFIISAFCNIHSFVGFTKHFFYINILIAPYNANRYVKVFLC